MIFYLIFALATLVPLGVSLLYTVIAVRQWMIGNQENSGSKKAGALKGPAISLSAAILVVLLWIWLIHAIRE